MKPSPTKPKRRQRRTKEQRTLILRLIKKMIGLGKYASEIKTAIADQFQLSPRSVERYLSSARREMRQRLETPLEQHRADSFYFYRSIIDSPESNTRDRIRARERIDKLLGTDSATPFKPDPWVEGLSPEDIKNMTDEELEAAYQRISKEVR
ncbi:hypothetical protein [uncultured Gimesia sp.]|uniref:hypothetical protein n=1 Tax=uncultured Gimesia sp. TaxID=1678688 RepID=UPI0026240DB0|nr:hypothetical protein [uncultured Gimesia sp.]